MANSPSIPADQKQRLIEARAGTAKMMNAARASQQESHGLVSETNFMIAPTLPGANHILSRMAKWERLLSDHRHKAWHYFEQYGIAEYIDCAELAHLDLDDFLSFVRKTKVALSSAPQPGAMQQPAPHAPADWNHQPTAAQQGAPPADAGLDLQMQRMLQQQRVADMKAMHEAQKATMEATQTIIQERLAQHNRHSARIRSLL